MSINVRKKSTARRGITLIEILICIGILAFGLLGVVALIPVGHFAVVETSKADRSTACAKAAKVAIRLHNMLDTSTWYGTYNAGDTIVLDPLGAIYGGTNNFPYGTTAVLIRRTIKEDDTYPMRSALAERLCRWEDDVIIDVDDSDPDLRPRQMYVFDTDEFAPYPIRTTDDGAPSAGAVPLVRQSKGDYSWFLTVTPDIVEVNAGYDPKTFEVSTVVCFKRNIISEGSSLPDVPPERLVGVTFSGMSGEGAADLALIAPGTLATDEERLEYLKVRKGQWLMLVGQETSGATPRTIARWYQVQTIDDEMTGGTVRWLTISGPEWDTSVITGTQAILVDDVIGVFTETMTAE